MRARNYETEKCNLNGGGERRRRFRFLAFSIKSSCGGQKTRGEGNGTKDTERGRDGGEEADSELIDDYCKRRLSGPSVRPSDGDGIWRTMELLIRPSSGYKLSNDEAQTSFRKRERQVIDSWVQRGVAIISDELF